MTPGRTARTAQILVCSTQKAVTCDFTFGSNGSLHFIRKPLLHAQACTALHRQAFGRRAHVKVGIASGCQLNTARLCLWPATPPAITYVHCLNMDQLSRHHPHPPAMPPCNAMIEGPVSSRSSLAQALVECDVSCVAMEDGGLMVLAELSPASSVSDSDSGTRCGASASHRWIHSDL